MIILHFAPCGDVLALWGEKPVEDGSARPRRGRKPKGDPAGRLPYDAGDELLRSALATAGIAEKLPRSAAADLTVWLPTQGGHPLASSPLIAEPPSSRAAVSVAPWTVSTLALTADQVTSLLGAAAGKTTLAPAVIVGQDLAFWSFALRLAGSLVARERFLPGLRVSSGKYSACWEPVFDGMDAGRIAALASQMPSAARALSGDGAKPPEHAVKAILDHFVGRIVDHLVRTSAACDRTTPKRRGASKPAAFESLHDQWLHALRSPDAVLEGPSEQLEELARQIRQWRRAVTVSTAAPIRLCFRLEEPPEDDGDAEAVRQTDRPWQVRYLLQAADDPSLLVPAEDAWATGGRKGAVLRKRGFDAKEYLLGALGQAAGICPRIESSLRSPKPSGYEVDAAGAMEFLNQRAAALQQAGFGVMLPAWWTRKGTKLHLSVRAGVKSPQFDGAQGMSMESVVHFQWAIALGDQTLTAAELEALAALKQPLVKLRGQWVQMSAEEIQAALDFWKKSAQKEATVREVVQMALGATRPTAALDFAGVAADGWVGNLLQQLEGKANFEELDPPGSFVGQLRPYQARGYSWLAFLRRWGLGACLADDMGLGKTIQTLALIQRNWHGDSRRPVLLICPTSVVGNWQKEASRFTPELPVMVHHGLGRAKQAAFRKAVAGQAIVISSYGLLHRDLDCLREVDWAGVVLDEAQNIKNPQTKQARAARSLKAEYRIALTGTPVENHVGDLWSTMEFLNPGLLGSQAEFKRSFFVPIQAMRDPDAAASLKRITGPFILRRLKTDRTIISDLPEKLEMKVYCTLTKEQASLYAAVLKEAEKPLGDADGIRRKGVILGMLSKLKQVCNHPAQFLGDNSEIPGRSGKLARLTEMLEEALEVGDRALIFSQFTEMGEILRRHIEATFGREVLFLHGGVPKRRRDTMVERFQTEDGPAVFLLSLKAGGTGLNLTRANHVFHFDRWWNPAVENQATDRAFRIGQKQNVQVHKFICAGTFEERIDRMIESKREIAEQVVGVGEGWLTELSSRELKQIFALGKEAVAT
ncbi:MAG: DEAD/DEAH box helicase [Rhodopirellula sp.]|nr:DEAD/DEAH box helicase [Rhodopirellula sp.]